jgi:hypothetical protein
MRKFLYILLVCMLYGIISCSSPLNTKPENSDINDSALGIVVHEEFLDLFVDTIFKDLHVYTLFQKPGGEKFKGNLIDSSYYLSFGDNIKDFALRDSDNKIIPNKYRGNFYACFKFRLNEKYTGLIIREPNQYCELAVALWIYDNKSANTFRSIELADSYGDENVYYDKDGWIQMENENIMIITHRENHEVIFLSESETKDSITSDKFQFYNFEIDHFVEVDTIPIIEKDLKMFNK